MAGFLCSLIITVMTAFSSGHALALEPTLSGNKDFSWHSVQGGLDGNPWSEFNGDLSASSTLRERFVDVPVWIVSEDFNGDGIYEAAVQFNEGTLRILSMSDDRLKTVSTSRNMAPAAPPVVLATLGGDSTGGLIGIDDRGDLVSIDYSTGGTKRLASGFSPLAHPVGTDLDRDGSNEIIALSDEGHMTVVKSRNLKRTDSTVQLLPDSHITVYDMDGDGIHEIVALSRPISDLSHARLGDDLVARGVAVFNWDGRNLRLKDELVLRDGQVSEMLTPLITGTGVDHEPALMLPVTEEGKGTQVRSYAYNKGRIREKRNGPYSGEGQWIHILGSSKMGKGERTYLITALVSEDDEGDLELYRLDLAQVKITLRSSISTHESDSRMLEAALIGDMDGDGEIELLAPGNGRSDLAIYSLDRSRLKEKEVFNSSNKLGTNLCPGDFNGDGKGDVMFGLDDGSLVVLLGE